MDHPAISPRRADSFGWNKQPKMSGPQKSIHEVLQEVIAPKIPAPKCTLTRFSGSWARSGTSLVCPNSMARLNPKSGNSLILDENGDIVIRVLGLQGYGAIEVRCSSIALSVSRNLAEAIAKLDSSRPLFLDLTRLEPRPLLFILQLVHLKNGSIPPHRPDNYEELLDIMDMSVKLACMKQVIGWLRVFTRPDGSSRLVGIQSALTTLIFADTFDPPAPARDFAVASAEFIRRSTVESLLHFKSTYLGSCFSSAVHDSLQHETANLVRTLCFHVEDTIVNMTKIGAIYPDSRKSCNRCSCTNLPSAVYCATCRNDTFQPHYCSPQSRGGVFVEALLSVRLFPIGQYSPDMSATVMIKKARRLRQYFHQCDTPKGTTCNLRQTLDYFHEGLFEIAQSVQGLCQECGLKDEDSRLSKEKETCGNKRNHVINPFLDAHEHRIELTKRAVWDLDEDCN